MSNLSQFNPKPEPRPARPFRGQVLSPRLRLPAATFGGDYGQIGFVFDLGAVKTLRDRYNEVFADLLQEEAETVTPHVERLAAVGARLAKRKKVTPRLAKELQDYQAEWQHVTQQQADLRRRLSRSLLCDVLARIEWPFSEPGPDLSDPATLDRLEAPEMLALGMTPVLDYLTAPGTLAAVERWCSPGTLIAYCCKHPRATEAIDFGDFSFMTNSNAA